VDDLGIEAVRPVVVEDLDVLVVLEWAAFGL
jgi:hypothetical protein